MPPWRTDISMLMSLVGCLIFEAAMKTPELLWTPPS